MRSRIASCASSGAPPGGGAVAASVTRPVGPRRAAEEFADGLVSPAHLLEAFWRADERFGAASEAADAPSAVAALAAYAACCISESAVERWRVADAFRTMSDLARYGIDGSSGQTALLRDIFGNPFRPAAFDPQWRSADVGALARTIYDDRAFDRMPIFADALMDAGCDDEQVIGHCRGPGPHVRGCWAVDLVLEKA